MKLLNYIDGLSGRTKTILLIIILLVGPFFLQAAKPVLWPPTIAARVDNLSKRVDTLNTRIDKIDGNFEKLERFSCYLDYQSAVISGMNCPVDSHK